MTSDAEVVDAGAVGEVAQRFGSRLAGAQLQVDQPQLVGQLGIGELELAADALQRLVEAEAGLDADDEEVEHVGERQADAVGAALGHPRQHHAGQDVAEAQAAERDDDVGLARSSELANSANSPSAKATRMPKKIVSASSRR